MHINQVHPIADRLKLMIIMFVKLNPEANLENAINVLRVIIVVGAHCVEMLWGCLPRFPRDSCLAHKKVVLV